MADNNDIRSEYTIDDLGKGVRGKYHQDVQQGTNLILLDSDVAQAFSDPKLVNDTLRALIHIAQSSSTQSNKAAITDSPNTHC